METDRRPIPRRYQPAEYRQRPRDLDWTICDEILERRTNGETLGSICQDLHMPLPGTFLTWVEQEADLRKRYEMAIRIGTDVNFDAALEEASRPGGSRTLVDTLKWHTERSVPEKYGPRSVVRNLSSTEQDTGGVDHRDSFMRKIEAISIRMREEAARVAAAEEEARARNQRAAT